MVVGLGNPGTEYEKTRHNAGFWVVDRMAETMGISMRAMKFGARFGEGSFEGKKFILLKPWQYMNRSGQPVATAVGFYKLPLEQLMIVVDDMALAPGRIRIRARGSAGGHNGLSDIIAQLGSDAFTRCRVGIGHQGGARMKGHVLGRPCSEEQALLGDAVDRAFRAVLCWAQEGVDGAMTRFNGYAPDEE